MHPQPQRHVQKRGANHGLHIFLTIITCGFWAITGWPIAAAMGRKTITTTYATPQQLPPSQQQYGYPPRPYGQQPPPGQYGPPPTGPYGQQPGQYPPPP